MYVLQYCSLGEAEDSIHTWNDKGIALGKLEKHEEVLACFDETIKLKPEYLVALYSKGDSLRKWGRDEEAEQCLAKARELQQC